MSDDINNPGPGGSGKIARLPFKVREELNRRLLDGQVGRVILEWVNGLAEVKRVLDEDFRSIPVTHNNLSHWRCNEHQKWLRRRERVEHTKELSRHAADLARAGGQNLAEGARAIASGKILELLELIEEATKENLTEGSEENEGPDKVSVLVALSGALSALRTSEQNDIRLEQNERKLKQKDEELALAREKFMSDAAGIALKVLGDERAKAIEAGAGSNSEKLELIGQHLFGELWKPKGTESRSQNPGARS